MKSIIIGAGASIEEAIRVNAPKEWYPPTIYNFAQRMWDTPPLQFTNYWLPAYLENNGIKVEDNPTKQFIELEKNKSNTINVERLFEFSWNNRGKLFEDDWKNLLYHGITNPLNLILAQSFFESGVGMKKLVAGPLVANTLSDGDIVVNLNYDTLFEIGLEQQNIKISYAPHEFDKKGLLIAKPHGSLNLLADNEKCVFCQPECFGAVPSGSNELRNYNSIVPPRFNKRYSQHPIAKMIISNIKAYTPSEIVFWGVGLTDSDRDLLRLYKIWCSFAEKVEVINPDSTVAQNVEDILKKKVSHFESLDKWLETNKNS